MPRACVGTTIPSYYGVRTALNLFQASTRLWWDDECSGFDLLTSLEAIEEKHEGDPKMARLRVQLLQRAIQLPMRDDVASLAQKLVAGGLIPDKGASEAIHIGVASVHRMDYIVTWNFKHIANPFMRDRLREMVYEAGFHLPVLCSPDELLQYNEDYGSVKPTQSLLKCVA